MTVPDSVPQPLMLLIMTMSTLNALCYIPLAFPEQFFVASEYALSSWRNHSHQGVQLP